MLFTEKNQKIAKKLVVLCAVLALCSLVIFIPQVRAFIIAVAEKGIGRSLTYDVWNSRFVEWEIEFISCVIFLFVSYFDSIKKINRKFIDLIAWAGILGITVCLIITAFQSSDAWLDETFSLGLARHSIKEIISLTAQDVHPPLYYIILSLITRIFNYSVYIAKCVSILPIVIIICVSQVFFTKEFSSKYALLFNTLFISTPLVLRYSVEIRMYTWCMLFCFLCCICSFYIINNRKFKYWLLYVIFAVLGAYTHYWTAVGLGIHYILLSLFVFINDKKKITYIVTGAILGIILYLPWLKIVITQMNSVFDDYWISPIILKTFIGYFSSLIPSFSILNVLITFILIFFIVFTIGKVLKKEKFYYSLFIICLVPFFLIIVATLVSIWQRPVFQEKYVYPFISYTIFFIVIVFYAIKMDKRLLFAFTFVSLILACTNIQYNYTTEKNIGNDNIKLKEIMNENLTPNAVFVFQNTMGDQVPYCVAFSYPENRIFNYTISDLWISAYSYNRKNLIENLNDNDDICYICFTFDENDILPFDINKSTSFSAKIAEYPKIKIYFIKNQIEK